MQPSGSKGVIEQVARATGGPASALLLVRDRAPEIAQIYEGTNQVQRIVMAKSVLK